MFCHNRRPLPLEVAYDDIIDITYRNDLLYQVTANHSSRYQMSLPWLHFILNIYYSVLKQKGITPEIDGPRFVFRNN